MSRLARLATASITLLAIPACFSSDDGPSTQQSAQVFHRGDPASIQLAEELTRKHLARAVPALADSLAVRKIEIDHLGYAFTRLTQTVSGIPVFGAEAVVKLAPNGDYAGKVDKLAHDVRVDTNPSIGKKQAENLAILSRGPLAQAVSARSDLQILLGHGAKARLTHRVQLDYVVAGQPHRPVVFIDAKTGAVVWSYDNLQTAKNRTVHNLNHGTTLPGPVARTEGGPATGDADVDTNYDLLGWTYDCYKNLYDRDSFDDAGAGLISSVHFDTDYVNAFWNGTQMVYGDGDGVVSISLAISMDVTAHELTHAVTEYTSNLIYSGESGGLNESMSDIFGNVCEWYRDNNGNTAGPTNPNNYLVGDEIWLPEPALRYMADPTLDGFSLDFWTSAAGNVDVHFSSGISNLAFYLLAEGGTHPHGSSPQVVTGIGIHDAGAIFYRANKMYLTPSSTFGEARVATVNAATDLFGAGSAQVTQTGNAWTAVGVLEPPDYEVIDTQSGLSGALDSTQHFSYPTNGATAMKFVITGGTGDADLYVRFGAPPTLADYDCRPYLFGNDETCEFNPVSNGTYYVMLHAYTAYSGVTLTVHAAGPTGPTTETVCTDGLDDDNDGAVDCADTDCIGSPMCPAPDWQVISRTNFELGMGPYTTGGVNALRIASASNASSPPYSVRIRAGAGTSSSFYTTAGFNLPGKTALRIQYSSMARGLEPGDGYLVELSVNGGIYELVDSFVVGQSFVNDTREEEDISVQLPGTSKVKVRFRSNSNESNDYIYIDDVVISAY